VGRDAVSLLGLQEGVSVSGLSRRQFMSRGLMFAAGGLAVPGWARWLSEQMERLQPRKHIVVVRPSGLRPVPGQPGAFYDLATGRTIGVRDFSEEDKYDTITIPQYANGGFVGVSELKIAPRGLM